MISEDGLLGSSGGSSGHGQSPSSREGRVPSLPSGMSTIIALSTPARPGARWAQGPGPLPVTPRSSEAAGAEGSGCQVRLTSVLAQGAGQGEELGGAVQEGPTCAARRQGQKVLLSLRALASPAGLPLPKATPDGFLAPSVLSDLGSAVSTEPGRRHFWKHQCQCRPWQLQAPQNHRHSLERGPEPWLAGQVPVAPLFSSLFPCWRSCQSDARQTPPGVQGHCISWQGHSLSGSRHSSSS